MTSPGKHLLEGEEEEGEGEEEDEKDEEEEEVEKVEDISCSSIPQLIQQKPKGNCHLCVP